MIILESGLVQLIESGFASLRPDKSVELGKDLANGFFQRDSSKLTFAMVELVELVESVELGIKEIINFVYFRVFRGLLNEYKKYIKINL